ncbi:MAG: hypothetical protein AAGG57_06630 [Pseudomonadota bacterium]
MTVWQQDHTTSGDSFCFVLDLHDQQPDPARNVPAGRHVINLDVVPELIEEMDLVRAAVERHVEKISMRTATRPDRFDLSRISAVYLPVREGRSRTLPRPHVVLPFSTIAFNDRIGVPYILVSSHCGFKDSIFSAFASLLDLANLMGKRESGGRTLHSFEGLNSQATDLVFDGQIVNAFRR